MAAPTGGHRVEDPLSQHRQQHCLGIFHDTPANADKERNYARIEAAGAKAKDAVQHCSLLTLGEAIELSYQAQREEGMNELPEAKNCLGRKYCGGGWGGYALYLFETEAVRDAFVRSEQCNRDIEPYITIR